VSETIGDERYELGRRLGSGGMATVYAARDLMLGREVAIKLLADNYAGSDEMRGRFMREARLAAKLDHPHVVRVFDVGEEDARPYIVMELVEGSTLADRLEARRRGLHSDAFRLLCEMCDGLGHAHSRRLVHRDIKPGNLLLRQSDGCLKIADFGIARAGEDTRLTKTGRVLGTERYMAPEQLTGGKITSATDVYACGVVADEVLPKSRSTETQEVIECCLREDPSERFRDANALGGALAAVSGEATATPPQQGEAPARTTAPLTVTERLDRLDPTRVLRRFGGLRGTRLAAVVAILALAVIALIALLDSGDSMVREPSSAAPPSVTRSEDAAEQARQLADFFRTQSR